MAWWHSIQACQTQRLKFLHDHRRPKAQIMNYWKGVSQVEKERPKEASSQWLAEMLKTAGPQLPPKKRGPHRKLDLEQELLLTLMRLRLDLLVDDLAFRFKVSHSLITQIFATWVRFLAKELSWLIMWPSKGEVQLELPDCFRRMYPKVRCITETPSALDVQAALWSTYKHHSTLKFLVAITSKTVGFQSLWNLSTRLWLTGVSRSRTSCWYARHTSAYHQAPKLECRWYQKKSRKPQGLPTWESMLNRQLVASRGLASSKTNCQSTACHCGLCTHLSAGSFVCLTI